MTEQQAVRHKWTHHDSSGRHKTCDKCKMTVNRFGIGRDSYYVWSMSGGIGGDTQGGDPVPGCLGYPDTHPASLPYIPRVCRHGRSEAQQRCRCREYTACCSVDLDEHAEAMARLDDGKQHG